MTAMLPDRDVEQAVGHISLFRKEIQAGYKYLSFIYTLMKFKVIKMDEITKKIDVNQKQKRKETLGLSPEHAYVKKSGKTNQGKFSNNLRKLAGNVFIHDLGEKT